MKTILCILVAALVFISSIGLAYATQTPPSIRLPSEYVTMQARYGKTSWFDMMLLDIPDGYDVTNGPYPGWCCEKSRKMTRGVAHTVVLWSSIDPTIPEEFRCGSWDKVNYVLNHKQGCREVIQQVIWYYTCSRVTVTNPDALAMIAEADEHGAGFVPQDGQIIAILIEGVSTIQRTFFEYTIPLSPQLGDLVWNDLNANGLQDTGEPGIPSVTVNLLTDKNVHIRTTMTDAQGYYRFSDLIAGTYYLDFVLPSGYNFTLQAQGNNVSQDSDVDPSTGRTSEFVLQFGDNDTSRDAGMYLTAPPTPPSQPSQPRGSRRSSNRNHAPTADGSAGEPYNGFIGETIIFNGTLSYDRDGTIISYSWMFGDGSDGSGAIASHVYTRPGNFLVLLTVTDDDHVKDTYETMAQIRLPNTPPSAPLLFGPREGHRGKLISFTAKADDPDNESVRYLFIWADGTSQQSPFFPSGSAIQFTHDWNTIGEYTITTDVEDQSGAHSSPTTMSILIDMHYVESLGYLMNTKGSGPYDMFHANGTGLETAVKNQGDWYTIDVNGDGTWDYLFNVQTHELKVYQTGFEWMNILLTLSAIIFSILILLFLFGRRKNVKVYEGSGSLSSK